MAGLPSGADHRVVGIGREREFIHHLGIGDDPPYALLEA